MSLFNGFIRSPPALPLRGAAAVGNPLRNFIALPSGTALAGRISPPPRLPPPLHPDSRPGPLPIHPAACTAPRRRCSHHGGSAPQSLKKERGRPRVASPLFTIINSPSFTSTSSWATGYPCHALKGSPLCSANSCQTSVLSSSP